MAKEQSKGIIIRQPWIDLILSGEKTWEIRGMSCKLRGRVRLIESGTGLVVGETEIIDCLGPFTLDELKKKRKFHQVSNERLMEWGGYEKNYAWVMSEAKRYERPQPYRHPSGAVIWVAAKHLPKE